MNRNDLEKVFPNILTGSGCVGVVVTAVLSGKASVKAHDILEKEREAKGENLTLKEKVKATAKTFVWTGISAAATIGCIAGVRGIDAKALAGAAGTLYAGAKKFSDYRKQSIKRHGVSEDREIMEEVKENEKKEEEILETICRTDASVDGAEKAIRYYDSYLNEFYWLTPYQFLEAQYTLNETFQEEGVVPLTDWHDILCVTHKVELENYVWHMDCVMEHQCYPWITITTEDHVDENGEPYKAVIFVTEPCSEVWSCKMC